MYQKHRFGALFHLGPCFLISQASRITDGPKSYCHSEMLCEHLAPSVCHSHVIVTLLCATRGSLLTRSLADIVKKDDFVLGSDYLVTLVVVVPK